MSISLNFTSLVNPVKANICSFLEKPRDFLNISQTCKALYQLIRTPTVEEVIVLGRNYTQILIHDFCETTNNPNNPKERIFALLRPLLNSQFFIHTFYKITDLPNFEKKLEEKFSLQFNKFKYFFQQSLMVRQISNQQLVLLKNPDFVKAQTIIQSSFSDAITYFMKWLQKMPGTQRAMLAQSVMKFLQDTHVAMEKQVLEEQKKIQEGIVKKQASHSATMKPIHDELLARVQPIAPIPPLAAPVLVAVPPTSLLQKVKDVSNRIFDNLTLGWTCTVFSIGFISTLNLLESINTKIVGDTNPSALFAIFVFECCITYALFCRLVYKLKY